MTDKRKTIRPCEFFSICEAACSGTLEDIEICSCYEIFKQLKRKEQECEELEKMVAEAEEAPICFHCKEEPCIRQERDKYKQALDEIECLCKNEACSPCKELEENNHCDECHNKIILDIINKTKEK